MDNPATERKIKSWVQRCSWRIGEEGRRTDEERKRRRKKGKKEEEQKGEGRECRTSRAERRATLEGRVRHGERVERAKREQEAAEKARGGRG